MAIISQETWDKFNPEEQREIRELYTTLMNNIAEENCGTTAHIIMSAMQDRYTSLFGKENLQPKPKIRTWKDMKEEYILRADTETSYIIDIDKKLYSEKLVLKALATLQIAKLIELGYGGIITDEEWRDENTEKWSVLNHNFGDFNIVNVTIRFGWKSFISFHTKQQAQEFISYPENVELIKQYYMI